MHSDLSLAKLLDDRQEWLRFSQPHKSSVSTESQDCWDSHVVVQGMHCAACAFTVEEALLAVPGVKSVEVNAATHRAKVVWSAQRVKPSAWMAATTRSSRPPSRRPSARGPEPSRS
jgi:Cu2+-exporting ATPase